MLIAKSKCKVKLLGCPASVEALALLFFLKCFHNAVHVLHPIVNPFHDLTAVMHSVLHLNSLKVNQDHLLSSRLRTLQLS